MTTPMKALPIPEKFNSLSLSRNARPPWLIQPEVQAKQIDKFTLEKKDSISY